MVRVLWRRGLPAWEIAEKTGYAPATIVIMCRGIASGKKRYAAIREWRIRHEMDVSKLKSASASKERCRIIAAEFSKPGATLASVGKKHGICRERVRQLLAAAKKSGIKVSRSIDGLLTATEMSHAAKVPQKWLTHEISVGAVIPDETRGLQQRAYFEPARALAIRTAYEASLPSCVRCGTPTGRSGKSFCNECRDSGKRSWHFQAVRRPGCYSGGSKLYDWIELHLVRSSGEPCFIGEFRKVSGLSNMQTQYLAHFGLITRRGKGRAKSRGAEQFIYSLVEARQIAEANARLRNEK